jgi:hypothetical protein
LSLGSTGFARIYQSGPGVAVFTPIVNEGHLH